MPSVDYSPFGAIVNDKFEDKDNIETDIGPGPLIWFRIVFKDSDGSPDK